MPKLPETNIVRKLLKPEDVANMLGISPTALRIRGHRKQGPACVMLSPRTARYSPADVDAYIAAAKSTPSTK